MGELSFNSYISFIIILFFQLETFFLICYNNVIFFTKNLKIQKTLNIDALANSNNNNKIFFFFILSSFLFSKNFIPMFWLLLIIIFILIVTSNALSITTIINKIDMNFFNILIPFFIGFLLLISFTNSFLIYFFFIELYGVLYYFIFLISYSDTNINLIKYKTSLLMLLWNNFFTTFFLALGCFFILYKFGSLNFTELNLLTTNYFGIYIFMLGLSWKLGVPLFHFFKLEIYKFLIKENVFLFTIITTCINIFLLYFSFLQNIIFNSFYISNLIVITLLFLINLFLINFNNYNILQYFAISGVLTISTFLILLIL